MKKTILFVMLSIIYFSSTATISGQNTESEPLILTNVQHFERLYDDQGNITSEQILDEDLYNERVSNERAARTIERIKENFSRNVMPNQNSSIYDIINNSDDDTINDSLGYITTNDIALEPDPGSGGSYDPDYCTNSNTQNPDDDDLLVSSEYSLTCMEQTFDDSEYTTHTTKMKVYFDVDPAVTINTKLTWDIMPQYRMTDIMAITYEEHVFNLDLDSISAQMSAHQYYYRYERNNGTE